MQTDNPTIVIDLDETLAPSYKMMGTIAGPGFGKVNSKEDVKRWTDLYDILGGIDTAINVFRAAGMWDVMKNFDPYPHAVEVMQRLHAAGVKLVIMSDRNPDTKESVVQWLTAHNIPFDALHCERLPNKMPLSREYGAVAIVDDKPLTMVQALYDGRMFVTGLRGPYNNDVAREHDIPLGNDWLEIEKILLHRFPQLQASAVA